MRNKFLGFIIPVVIAGNATCQCLASSTESSTESQHESGVGIVTDGPSLGSQVNQSIQQDSHLSPAAKHIDVTDKDGAVIIRGSVPTASDKQKINSAAEKTGAPNIRNEVKVENSGINKKIKPKPKMRIIKP